MAVARHVRGWAVACSAKISALVALVRLWIHRLYRLPLADAVPDPFLHVPRWRLGVPRPRLMQTMICLPAHVCALTLGGRVAGDAAGCACTRTLFRAK